MILTDISNLGKYSKKLILVKCDLCNIEKTISLKLYTSYGYTDNSYLCRKCKLKKNNLEKYGVENTFQLQKVKEKIKNTNLERYGVNYISQSKDIQEKIKNTNLERYGTTHHMKNEEILNKVKETNLIKYGVDNVSKSELIKNKKIITCNYNFGVDYIRLSDEFRKKFNICQDPNCITYLNNGISIFRCESGHNFEIHLDNYIKRIKYHVNLCTICHPIGDGKSIKEKELMQYIQSIYSGEIIQSYRDNLELDIYLPALKIGFEFNGVYWHSEKYKEKNYHLDKTNHFKKNGIRVIHIWEDDWYFNQKIIKSQINNLLNVNRERVFARNCKIREVDIKSTRQFLDNNHIQGFVNSKIKLGLYYNDELMSIMIFDNSEGRKKMEEGGWNLSRFCNKINTNVVGGASKLLNHFINNYHPTRIISYADKDWSIGQLYYILGFKNIHESNPDYKYIVNDRRVHKSRYQKSKLKTLLTESETMESLGINRIYDCGKIKFELVV